MNRCKFSQKSLKPRLNTSVAKRIKEARAAEGEGMDGKIAQFIRSASAEELDEIYRYIDFLESKREKK